MLLGFSGKCAAWLVLCFSKDRLCLLFMSLRGLILSFPCFFSFVCGWELWLSTSMFFCCGLTYDDSLLLAVLFFWLRDDFAPRNRVGHRLPPGISPFGRVIWFWIVCFRFCAGFCRASRLTALASVFRFFWGRLVFSASFPHSSPLGFFQLGCVSCILRLLLHLGCSVNNGGSARNGPDPTSLRFGSCCLARLLLGVVGGTVRPQGRGGDRAHCDPFHDYDHNLCSPVEATNHPPPPNKTRPFRQCRVLLGSFLLCLQLRCRLKVKALEVT